MSRRLLGEGEPPHTFLEFFWNFLVPHMAVSGSCRERALGSRNLKKPRCGDLAKEGAGKGCVRLCGEWPHPSRPYSNSMGDLLCEEEGLFKERRA